MMFFAKSYVSAHDAIAVTGGTIHNHPMGRLFFATILITLSACSRVENSFVVIDQQNLVSKAMLVLCGTQYPLQRTGARLVVRKPVTCEGSGHITLHFVSGDEHDCIVGYVTPGMAQSFVYRATPKGCA